MHAGGWVVEAFRLAPPTHVRDPRGEPVGRASMDMRHRSTPGDRPTVRVPLEGGQTRVAGACGWGVAPGLDPLLRSQLSTGPRTSVTGVIHRNVICFTNPVKYPLTCGFTPV